MKKSEIGLIGLAVMGQNLARNISRSHKISVYNRTVETTEAFLDDYASENLVGHNNLNGFVNSLATPRQVGIMVQAGTAVDKVIESLLPLLDSDDTIIDFGNSNFHDTIRREKELANMQINFFGCGVSGGEEGALNGPSLMPGGSQKIYNNLKPIFENVAANDFNQGLCVSHIGENGAGHFVKMVHNGIEYGVMQMMAEAYEILSRGYGLSAPDVATIFEQYNAGKLHSYLFEIAVPILKKEDDISSGYLLDKIMDAAGQKGTGTWTAIESLNVATSLSVITEAVYARIVSSERPARLRLSKLYEKQDADFNTSLENFIPKLENALFAAMLVSYTQGFSMLEKAADEFNWQFNFSEISRVWQGGCIIRADILAILQTAFATTDTTNLLEIPEIIEIMNASTKDFRLVVSESIGQGIPLFSLTGALSSFEAMTNAQTSANFIQALRDSFGAHTFLRNDQDGVYHADWSEDGKLTLL